MVAKLNLMLHCGAHKVGREQVYSSPTPEGTKTWHPIPHRTLIDLVEEKLPNYDMEVVQEQHGLMRDGSRYFGLFQIKATDGGSLTDDYGLVLGVRNSHDKSIPAGLCLGSGVFVCDNLAFSAEVVIGRRHTRYILDDLPRLIGNALGKLVQARQDQDVRIKAYKERELGDKEAAHLILKAFEHKAINQSRIAKVWEQWKTPNHPEFKERNIWSLFNGFTEAQKGLNPFELSQRTQRLHGLMDAAANLTLQTAC